MVFAESHSVTRAAAGWLSWKGTAWAVPPKSQTGEL